MRTGRHYPINFCVDLGQRNATFVKKPQSPLARYLPWADAFGFFPGPGWDLIHTVNAVPLLTNRPFIVTFEDYLPRTPEDRGFFWLQRPLRRLLLSPRCVRLLAMSEYGIRIFRRQNAQSGVLDRLLSKTEVLYPAVAPRSETPKKLGDRLRLCFVGSDFMRKGGPALLRAHQMLKANGVPVETTIVSSLRWSKRDYVGPPSESVFLMETARLRSAGVRHLSAIPNEAVLHIMDESHFLVFPTFHDTFGFVSIEAMAGATPVITNATCAQVEIVEDRVSGYLMPLENDEVGRWAWLYKTSRPEYVEAYVNTLERIAYALVKTLMQAWENRSDYEKLSEGAIQRIRERFHRERARERLEAIYDSIFATGT